MAAHRRRAEIVATLVDLGEPQLLALKAGKSLVVAVAVPDDDHTVSRFLATTVSQRDWDSYFDETVDLRYLFTYSSQRLRYLFDLQTAIDGKVTMEPFSGDLPDKYLPLPRFFADNHTEDFGLDDFQAGNEKLIVDGSWDMPEFGRFYQKYSDIYSFLVAILNWNDETADGAIKDKIAAAFSSKPFRGGSSYRHFYQDLVENLVKGERLGLQEIKYASPGHVDVHGREDAFEDVQGVIRWFMDHRADVTKVHSTLRTYLSKLGLLQIAGANFDQNDPRADYILGQAKILNDAMHGPDFLAIKTLAKDNALVAAKIVMSFYRRVDEASQFFSQGRVNFAD